METKNKARLGAAAAFGLLALAVPFTLSSSGATPAPLPASSIALHNNTAGSGEDCPSDGKAYWHFVLAPNNGSSAFVSIHLELGDTSQTFTGFPPIVKNGNQTDNVFVPVPAGSSLDDLETSGSFAVYSGATPTQFNLSHVCEGDTPPTTPTTVSNPPTTPTTVSNPPTTPTTVSNPPTTPTTATVPPTTPPETVPPETVPPETVPPVDETPPPAQPAPVSPHFTG